MAALFLPTRMISTDLSPAQTAPAAEAAASSARFTVFERCRQHFALGIDLVREVLPGLPLTRVPRSADHILGVASLRGEILPVITIDRWLGLAPADDNSFLPILVLRKAELLVGLRVDAIRSVSSMPLSQIQPHPNDGAESYLSGIWHPEGRQAITLIAGSALLETLCSQTAINP